MHGAIREKYVALEVRPFFGYPVTDAMGTPGPARFSRFQNGATYWTPFTSPQETSSPTYVLSLDDVTFAAGHTSSGNGHGANMTDLLVATGGSYADDLLTTTVHRSKRLPGHYLNSIGIPSTKPYALAQGRKTGKPSIPALTVLSPCKIMQCARDGQEVVA